MKVSEEKTPSQASQEAADPLEILKDAEDTARVARNHCHLQPSYWSANCFKEIRERISEARTLLSHPPKGGAKPAPIKDEDYPHSLDDCIQRMEFLAIEGIADGSRPRIGGLCLSVAEHLGRLKSLEEGVRGPVARGGLPVPAAQEYRDLMHGEIIKATDEIWAYGKGPWEPVEASEIGAAYIAFVPGIPKAHHKVRRRIETPPASGEASEPAPSPVTSPSPAKPSQGRECWVLFAKKSGKVLHACNDYDGPTDWSDREWKRMVEAEVVEPQENGETK
jgi:hypothetical protein